MSFADRLGFERLPSEAGSAVLRARVGAEHVNMHGSAHGGFLYSLADEAFAVASNSREADAVALSVHMDYFQAVFPGDLVVARAREEHLGRNVATYRVEVTRLPDDGATRDDGEAATGGPPRAEPAEGATVALFTGTVYRRLRRTGAS